MKKIIVDTLGSDNGCYPIVSGALCAMMENKDISLVFVGNKSDINKIIEEQGADKDRIEIIHTQEFVPDDALPTCVFRGCDNASMVLSLETLKNTDDALAMISAGNTGALLVGTIFRLGLSSGLRSPALATALPCKKDGKVCLVDCGANTDCTPEDLKRFAVMGNAFIKALEGIENPKVALMSVGPTAHKGNTLVKEAYPLIQALPINFVGNIEGNNLVNSEADVIVTDGFTGNILLKNTEAAGMEALAIVEDLGKGLDGYSEIIEELKSRFAFNDRGGAVFLGAKKTVVKMHGCANRDTACACVRLALTLEERNLSQNVSKALEKM